MSSAAPPHSLLQHLILPCEHERGRRAPVRAGASGSTASGRSPQLRHSGSAGIPDSGRHIRGHRRRIEGDVQQASDRALQLCEDCFALLRPRSGVRRALDKEGHNCVWRWTFLGGGGTDLRSEQGRNEAARRPRDAQREGGPALRCRGDGYGAGRTFGPAGAK